MTPLVMKRCSKCNRVEADDSLAFCRADGTALIAEFMPPPPPSEAGTAKISSGAVAREVDTSILPSITSAGYVRTTGPTTALPASKGANVDKPKLRKSTLIVIGILGLFAICGAAALAFTWKKRVMRRFSQLQ